MQVFSIHRFTASLTIALCVASATAQVSRPNLNDTTSVANGIPELMRAGNAAMPDAAPSSEVVRSRPVIVDLSVLAAVRQGTAVGRPQTVSLKFFDDAPVQVQITRTESFGSAGTAYIGTVPGIALSSVVIVEENGVVSANVNLQRNKYQIQNRGESGHVVRQIDPGAFPRDHPASSMSSPVTQMSSAMKAQPATAAIQTAADDGSIVDVMVVYTPAARISQGGTLPMKSLIDLAVAETNNAYFNSQVTQRIRLVYAGEVSHTESDLATDLARLQGASDGFMDEVHQLRNLYGADLVSLWGNYPAAAGCGQSYLMLVEDVNFAAQAFNVVDRNCAASNYTFAHELGHNMGLQHDIADGNAGTTVTPEGSGVATSINYAHGYVDRNNRFRTVMGISAQCDLTPTVNCLRIPIFSNPNVNFDNGAFFSGAVRAPTGNTSSQESRALNDTRDSTANFRASVDLTGSGTVIFSPAAYSINEAAANVTLTVARHAGSSGAVTVSYATTGGTAIAGTDYTPSSGTLTWASGETGSKTIAIPILPDRVLDGPKTVIVSMSTPTGGVSIGAPGGNSAIATVNILDADTDSFPPGCTLPITGWSNPAPGWAVASDSYFGPACSLKSNPTADGTKAQIQFIGELTSGTISFARRVSSQSGNDCLRFFIDGVAQDIGGTCFGSGGFGASGEVDWAMVRLPNIAAGTHTLTWSYEKDASGAAGADAAWIDSVVIPLAGPPAIQSAPPPGGLLNIPYSHSFVATGAPPITYSVSGALPPGVTLAPNGMLSGTPTAVGTFTAAVTATNINITSFERQFISISIVSAAPGAPLIVGATPDNGRATISFTPPANEGSGPISVFTATCNPGAIRATSLTSPIIVAGLLNGTEYTCAVTATNPYGTSASSASVLLLPLAISPGAPTIGVVTPGNAQAFVAFTPPATDGGLPITSYTATCNPGGFTGSSRLSPVTVNNLINGATYSCSVTAANAVGSSAPSATIAVTPSASAALSLVGVASRKAHGASGAFDIAIDTVPSISGLVTVEPRLPGNGHTIVFRFNSVVSSAGTLAVADSNNATVGATIAASGNDVIVTIPNLADNKRIRISLAGVTGPNGTAPPQSVAIGFLVGDVNNSRSVNANDISAVKAQSGQITTPTNFRFDLNASGAINSSDVSAVRARSGLVLQ